MGSKQQFFAGRSRVRGDRRARSLLNFDTCSPDHEQGFRSASGEFTSGRRSPTVALSLVSSFATALALENPMREVPQSASVPGAGQHRTVEFRSARRPVEERERRSRSATPAKAIAALGSQ